MREPRLPASRGIQSCTIASLPYFLQGVKGLPTQIIWGKNDATVPVSAAEAYRSALKNTDVKVTVFDDCGHRPEIEKPEAFLKLVREFLA